MEKTDIRARFTMKVLQDSLLALMKEKSIMDITIKEICALAGLSRSTFYTYCKDQYDLLRQIEEQLLTDAQKMIQQYIRAEKKSGKFIVGKAALAFEEILQYIADNGNSMQVLLGENGDSGFQKKYFRIGIEEVRQLAEAVGAKSADNYCFFYVVGGTLVLVQEWLKNGMDTPVPQIAKMLTRLMRDALG
ncbi:TetR family transcriptional regulator [Spirochaetia bacterium]|nr:TetR family transcriptional regulator [Spirochaetia bacterium]